MKKTPSKKSKNYEDEIDAIILKLHPNEPWLKNRNTYASSKCNGLWDDPRVGKPCDPTDK